MGYNPTPDVSIYTLQRRIRRPIRDTDHAMPTPTDARPNTNAAQSSTTARRFSVERLLSYLRPRTNPAH